MFLYVSYKETKGYYSTKKTICQQAINKYNKIPCSATKGWSPVDTLLWSIWTLWK